VIAMPFTFDCRECGKPIEAGPEMTGKRGRCPHCYAAFTIPDPRTGFSSVPPLAANVADDRARVEEETFDDRDLEAKGEPRQRSPRSSRPDRDHQFVIRRRDQQWHTVQTGLTLMRVGLIIVMITGLGLLLVAILAVSMWGDMGRNRQSEMLLGMVFILSGLANLVSLILFAVGQCMCCAAPEESGVRGLGVGSTVCLFASLGFGVIGLVFAVLADQRGNLGAREGLAILAVGCWLLGAILGVTSHILLVAFVRNTARYFRNESLAASGGTYLILFVIFVVSWLVAMVLMVIVGANRFGGGASAGIVLLVVGTALVVLLLVLLLFFLDLLGRTRTSIAHADEW
jgi:hypothetical protein